MVYSMCSSRPFVILKKYFVMQFWIQIYIYAMQPQGDSHYSSPGAVFLTYLRLKGFPIAMRVFHYFKAKFCFQSLPYSDITSCLFWWHQFNGGYVIIRHMRQACMNLQSSRTIVYGGRRRRDSHRVIAIWLLLSLEILTTVGKQVCNNDEQVAFSFLA